MSYEVLARKWRPQQFDDVVGQDHVVRTLRNAIETERIAHAYLFVGPRGTGKTSMARIFAKALNCEKKLTASPCDACDICKEIIAGNNLDVLEIDGASNNSVDQIRDLRESVRYAPARSRFKIYIIDEVHMLSMSAFNALLKTLEEPPTHVKFIFATTEPQKLPATIISRCQRFDLRRIAAGQMVQRLQEVANAEKITIEETALLAIARGAEGGLRDAESALDQLIAFRGDKITEEDVLSVFGLVAWSTLEDLVDSVLKGDISEVIKLIAQLDERGKDLQRLILELLEYFRNLLVVIYTDGVGALQDLTKTQIDVLKQQGTLSEPPRVLQMVEVLTETEGRLRYTLSKRILVETSLIRCARVSVVVSIDQILEQLNTLKINFSAMPISMPSEYKQEDIQASQAVPTNESLTSKTVSAIPSEPEPISTGEETAFLSDKWHKLVDEVGHIAPLAKNYLLDGKPLSVVGDKVTIGFDPEFASNKGKISFPRNLKAIQNVMGKILGRSVSIEFCVLDSKTTLPGDSIVETVKSVSKKLVPLEELERKEVSKSKREWLKDPSVRKTLEAFNGDIADIRE